MTLCEILSRIPIFLFGTTELIYSIAEILITLLKAFHNAFPKAMPQRDRVKFGVILPPMQIQHNYNVICFVFFFLGTAVSKLITLLIQFIIFCFDTIKTGGKKHEKCTLLFSLQYCLLSVFLPLFKTFLYHTGLWLGV